MAISFEVSLVEPARDPLPTAPLQRQLERLVGSSVEAFGGAVSTVVVGVREHPLLAAARLAFCQHRPLVLRPDDVWMCLTQGLAQHLALHAEELRERLVDRGGQETLVVERHDFVPGAANPWPELFGAYCDAIARRIGRRRDLVVAGFSTTGPAERAASEVVLLEALRPFFRYELHTFCGIPSVTLDGTPADWRSIVERARNLGELGLEPWVRALEPVLARLVATADGRPDAGFWRSFFTWESGSGGHRVTGWVNALFPYLVDAQGRPAPNPFAYERPADGSEPDGPTWERFPTGLSRAPLRWIVQRSHQPPQTLSMELLGGFVGVSQDPVSLALRPELGWAVRPACPPPPGPDLDPATGRRLYHLQVVGPRGPTLDGVLDRLRDLSPAAGAVDGSFDLPGPGDSLLRVWPRPRPDGVPSALLLVVGAATEDWSADAASWEALESILLASGRFGELPLAGLWPHGAEPGLVRSRWPEPFAALAGPLRIYFSAEQPEEALAHLRGRLA